MRRIFFVLFFSFFYGQAYTQIEGVEELWKNQMDSARIKAGKPDYLTINEEDALKLFNRQPSFGIYKDNYFVVGVPLNKRINRNTADAKFQISIRHRLTKAVLPWNTFLMLVYTQKSFWNIFEDSFPFFDNNYNPGLHISKPLILNNELKGMASFGFEHESNGRDSTFSRSYNYFVFNLYYYFNSLFSAQAKIAGGWLSSDNPDLYKCRGFATFVLNYRSRNERFWCTALINPRQNPLSINTQLEISYKISRKSNQFFFLQWFNGYGEGLLEYDVYTSMVRVGFCIKPPMRSIY